VVAFVQGDANDKTSEISGQSKVYHELGRYGQESQELASSRQWRTELEGLNRF
jgi:hypothetical protein